VKSTLTVTLNEMKTLQGVPEDSRSKLAAIDEIGGPKHHNHFPLGWAWAIEILVWTGTHVSAKL